MSAKFKSGHDARVLPSESVISVSVSGDPDTISGIRRLICAPSSDQKAQEPVHATPASSTLSTGQLTSVPVPPLTSSPVPSGQTQV